MNKDETAGKVAFEAYSKSVGGKTYDGRDIPAWESLTDSVRDGWIAAANAVIKALADEFVRMYGLAK